MRKRIFLVAMIATTLIASVTGCKQKITTDQQKEFNTKLASFQMLVTEYGFSKSTWPKDITDLKQFAKETNRSLDLSIFSNLVFNIQDDGSLKLDYKFALPFEEKGSWYIRAQWHPGSTPARQADGAYRSDLQVEVKPHPKGGLEVVPVDDSKK